MVWRRTWENIKPVKEIKVGMWYPVGPEKSLWNLLQWYIFTNKIKNTTTNKNTEHRLLVYLLFCLRLSYSYFMAMGVLPECTSEHHMCTVPRGQKKTGLELQMVVSWHVRDGKWTSFERAAMALDFWAITQESANLFTVAPFLQ